MPTVVVAIVATVITIGTTVYNIAKSVYDFIIVPITKIKEIVDTVRDTVKGVVKFMQDKIDYVLEVTGADVMLDLIHGIGEFTELAEAIAKGETEALLTVLGGLYTSIAGLGKDIIHIISDTLAPITDRLAQLKKDIININEFKIATLWKAYEQLGEQVKEMNADLISQFEEAIESEIAFLKSDMTERVRYLEGEIGKVRYLAKDIKNFMEMFTKAMEV